MKVQKNIVAIGGGELRDLETLSIDRAVVRLAKKKTPKVLFIPTASNDAVGYWEIFKYVYGQKLGCKTEVLFLIKDKPTRKEIEESILSADIIYVGGGNTLRMLTLWRKKGVDMLLKKAHEKGTVLVGLSAGAICWFRYGVSDSRRFMNGKQRDMIMRVRGLDLVPCTISPHHIREKRMRDKGIKDIMQRTSGIGLAIDDNVAILIQNNVFKILRSGNTGVIRKVFLEKGKIKNVFLADEGRVESLLSKSDTA